MVVLIEHPRVANTPPLCKGGSNHPAEKNGINHQKVEATTKIGGISHA